MKHILLFCIVFCNQTVAFGQVVNPTIIQQDTDILLQDSDLYYAPFAPPGQRDTRANLSNECAFLNDSNGVGGPDWYYKIAVYDSSAHSYVNLMDWAPRGTLLGQFAVWQRLFTAKGKPDGTPSDIIAGGGAAGSRVTVSKNEDVDFRASGRIKLKSGFHVKPGAFFHAYTEPKWDTAVFSDEFDDIAKFDSQWHITSTWGSNYYTPGAECSYDSNVRLVADPDAHDGQALDIIMREDTVDYCHCFVYGLAPTMPGCGNYEDTTLPQRKFIFSTGMIRSCPFPYTQIVDSPFAPAYAHEPYGKYEIREKIPHVMHHTNNWGGGFPYGFEWDLNETNVNGNMGILDPGWNHALWRGPFKGAFGRLPDSTVIFTSSDADWCPSKNPNKVIINNVPYGVRLVRGHSNTVEASDFTYYTGWPSSLANAPSTDTFSFYYTINDNCKADALPWHVYKDSAHQWRIFSAGYHDSSGHLLHFSKTNQPTSVTLTTAFRTQKKFYCRWDSSINWPVDRGLLLFDLVANDTDSIHTMASTDLDSNTEAYSFNATDLYSDAGYPEPYLPFNADDTTGHYEYHTFAMEWLPHEVRYLIDSVVVRRFPDRLIPPGTPYSDWVTTMPRALTDIRPAETDFDKTANDSLGADTSRSWSDPTHWWYNSITHAERMYFEHAASVELAHPTPGWPGFEMVDGKPVAHYLIDYIKVWDVPKDVFISDLPH